MKEMTLFYNAGCPRCKSAFRWKDELFESYPEYKKEQLDVKKLCGGFTRNYYAEDAYKSAYGS